MKLRQIDTALIILAALCCIPMAKAADVAASKTEPGKVERIGQTAGQFIDDATLTTRVKVALLNDDLLSAFDVRVRTEGGIVTLSGEVDKAETMQRAIKVASAIPGVRAINAHMMVKISRFSWDDRNS